MFYNPVQVFFGTGKLVYFLWHLKRYIYDALILTTQGCIRRGTLGLVLKALNGRALSVVSSVESYPSLNYIRRICSAINTVPKWIIALGGGSVIDVAKCVSLCLGNQDRIDYIIKRIRLDAPADAGDIENIIPILSVPTTAGTGSEITSWATVWDRNEKKKYSLCTKALWSKFAILDPQLTISLPEDITIAVALDALSHAFESLWNKKHNPISSIYAKEAIVGIVNNLPHLAKDLSNIKLREKIMESSLYAGLAASSTKTALAHSISYYLTLHKNIPHGIASSFSIPKILEVAIKKDATKRMFKYLFGNSEELISKIRNLFDELNIATDIYCYVDNIDEVRKSLSFYKERTENSLVGFEEINW